MYEVVDGVTKLSSSIVHHNIASPNITEIPDDQETTAVYVWIGSAFGAVSPYQQFFITNFGFDANVINAEVKLPKGNQAHTANNPKGVYLLVRYTCNDWAPPKSTAILNFTLSIGWQQEVSFKLLKHCHSEPPPTNNGGGSSSSAWSPFGIFAFTVFLLILVWCLVGCSYNYIAKDQRGADAIPGINFYRSVYQRCFPSPKYTPQTDYNYKDDKESPDYGGTSYQSENL